MDLDSLSKDIPVLSEYAKGLETHVKRRYLQKISLVRVDLASIPSDQFYPGNACHLSRLQTWLAT